MGAAHGWDSLAQDVDRVRAELDESDHAEADGRVTDRASYLAAHERLRRRLADLQAEARGREEAQAELEYGGEAA